MKFEINGLVIVSISAKWHVLYDELPLKYSLKNNLSSHLIGQKLAMFPTLQVLWQLADRRVVR